MKWRITPVFLAGVAGLAWLLWMVIVGFGEVSAYSLGLILMGAGIPAVVIFLIVLLEQAMVDHARPDRTRLILAEGCVLAAAGAVGWIVTESLLVLF